MDSDVLAYRVLLDKRKENAPFWEKKVIACNIRKYWSLPVKPVLFTV